MDDDTVPQPPEPDEEEPTDEMLEKFKKERVSLLTDMYGRLSELYSFERDLVIYRTIKNGYASVYQMAAIANLTPPVVYKILDRVESGEYQ